MRRIGVIVALGGLLSMLGGAVTASPALADTGARPLNLNAPLSQFTSFACLNDLCSLAFVTVDGKATSNLSTGAGSYHADLTVDFLGQPAPGVRVECPAREGVEPGGLHQIAVDVELLLSGGAVPILTGLEPR